MDYQPFDISVTDDDLPASHPSRMPRGGPVGGTGSSVASFMESQIHQLEQEAYSSVLRAFKAQADAISWEKESLISDLRKELRLSSEEHRDLLSQANADDVIRRIREWRETSAMLCPRQAVHDAGKKPKIASSAPSFHPQAVFASHQPSLATKVGPISGLKSKNQKPPRPYSSAGPFGSGQVARVSSGTIPGAISELIGKRVKTRWPDDNTFYEAVIYDYNPHDGRHALVYDIGSTKETWEWVNLSEISPEDIQWEGDDPGKSRRGGYGILGVGKGKGRLQGQPRKDLLSSQNEIGKKNPDHLQLLNTDTLIKEVERVFGPNCPDPIEIERAKKVLKDHEEALVDAISRLQEFSDDEREEGDRRNGQASDRV